MTPSRSAGSPGILFWLEPFSRHMDGLCWLIQRGLAAAGWQVVGHGFPPPGDTTDVMEAVRRFQPRVALFWTGPEWGTSLPQQRALGVMDEHAFRGWERLEREAPEVVRGTFFVDAGSNQQAQREWHERLRPQLYLTPYHPDSVVTLNPHIPRSAVVRYHHPIEAERFPPFGSRDGRCVISGATGTCYPFRSRMKAAAKQGLLGEVTVVNHPGYHGLGCVSLDYNQVLAKHRVAICTCSSYKFALRKHIEATASGCRVITNLPEYDVLPEINDNLRRVGSGLTTQAMLQLIDSLASSWDVEEQAAFALAAREYYDYRAVGKRLAEELRKRST